MRKFQKFYLYKKAHLAIKLDYVIKTIDQTISISDQDSPRLLSKKT